MAVYLPQATFSKLVHYLLSQAEESTRPENSRTFLQALASISESVGPRMGPFIEELFPVIESHATISKFGALRESSTGSFEGDAELRETAFEAFETIVTVCPKEITSFIPRIIELSLDCVGFDPNFNEDVNDEFPVDDDDEDLLPSDDEDDGNDFQDDEGT